MKNLFSTFLLILVLGINIYAQNDTSAKGNVEVYLIDSFITPELPHKLKVSFFTSDSVTSDILITGQEQILVSKELTDNHKIEINIDTLHDLAFPLKYRLIVRDKDGEESQSQIYEVEMPQNMIIETDRSLGMLQVCCFGGIIFGLPSPTYVSMNGKEYFSLTKEIPLFSFYSKGYNYPAGYFGIEYAYIFKADKKNFVRIGYKHIFQLGFIKYISPGLNYFTDFKGYNGISPELTLGFFQIQNVFTLFARYRYNFQPGINGTDFHEVSVGLYSNFFSINF